MFCEAGLLHQSPMAICGHILRRPHYSRSLVVLLLLNAILLLSGFTCTYSQPFSDLNNSGRRVVQLDQDNVGRKLYTCRTIAVREGTTLRIKNSAIVGCRGVLFQLGEDSALELVNTGVQDCSSVSALIEAKRGATVTIQGSNFTGNTASTLINVGLLGNQTIMINDTTFRNNGVTGAALIRVQNLKPFRFDNATLAYPQRKSRTATVEQITDALFARDGDPTGVNGTRGRSMSMLQVSHTYFIDTHFTSKQAVGVAVASTMGVLRAGPNTAEQVAGGSLLKTFGTRVSCKDCTMLRSRGFGELLQVTRGALDLVDSRLLHNVGHATGRPTLVAVRQGAGLTALSGGSFESNSRTSLVQIHGFSHWVHYALNSTADKKDTVEFWNETLIKRVWDEYSFAKFANFSDRWDTQAVAKQLIYYRNCHASPLLLRGVQIHNNELLWGGVVARNTSENARTFVLLDKVTFQNNSVAVLRSPALVEGDLPGGLVNLMYTVLHLRGAHFVNNTTPHIVHSEHSETIFNNLTFSENKGNGDDHTTDAIWVKSASLNLTSVQVVGNIGFANIIQMDSGDLGFQAVNTSANRAGDNILVARSCVIKDMLDSVFDDNQVGNYSIVNLTNINIHVWNNTRMTSNRAASSILYASKYYKLFDPLPITDSDFLHNRVVQPSGDGSSTQLAGAMLLEGSWGGSEFVEIMIGSCTFINNQVRTWDNKTGTATAGGGAVRVMGDITKSVTVTRCKFQDNVAQEGGAIHSVHPTVISECKFIGNRADRGGGAVAMATLNSAGIDSIIDQCNFTDNDAGQGLGANAPSWDYEKAMCPYGGGGALCIRLMTTNINVTSNRIVDSDARFGGALLVDNAEGAAGKLLMCNNALQRNKVESGAGPVVYFTSTFSQGLSFIQCGNTCTTLSSYTDPEALKSTSKSCSEWNDDSNPKGSKCYGAEGGVATGPATIVPTGGLLNDADRAARVRSGEPLDVSFTLQDNFGQNITQLPYNFTVTADNQGEKFSVFGDRTSKPPTVTKQSDIFTLSNVVVQPNGAVPNNSTHALTLNAMTPFPLSIIINITLRPCSIGERFTDSYSCLPCGNGTFANDPTVPDCANCPGGGDCSRGILIPTKGYWQSSPQSRQVHRCPLVGACPGNKTELLAFLAAKSNDLFNILWSNVSNLTDDTTGGKVTDWTETLRLLAGQLSATNNGKYEGIKDAYTQQQCAAGHEGYLCGVCSAPRWGRFMDRCVRCPRRVWQVLIVLAVLVLLVVVLSFTVFSHLKIAQRWIPRPTMIEEGVMLPGLGPAEAEGVGRVGQAGVGGMLGQVSGASEAEAEATSNGLGSTSKTATSNWSAATFKSALEQEFADEPLNDKDNGAQGGWDQNGAVGLGAGLAVVQQHKATAPAREWRGSEEQSELTLSQEAAIGKWTAVNAKAFLTVAKIFVSYLQVMGITRAVQLQWPPALRAVSRFDFTSLLTYMSLDCALGGTAQRRAITQVVLVVLLPVLMSMGAAVLWGVLVLRKYRRKELLTGAEVRHYFHSRLTLTVLQICYYLYPVVSMTILQIFTCVTVDTSPDGDTITQQYMDQTPLFLLRARLWTQHYNTTCFRGPHKVIMIALGVPGIILFCLGFPLWSAYRLWRHRHSLMDPDTVLRYGFLYEEYREQYFFWETLIMMRKALLLVCTVFLAPSGAATQLLTAVAVLSACLFLQVKYRPFDAALMNRLETYSLLATQFTLLGLAYFVPAVGVVAGVRIALTIILTTGNLLLVCFFLWHLIRIARVWLSGAAIVRHARTMLSKSMPSFGKRALLSTTYQKREDTSNGQSWPSSQDPANISFTERMEKLLGRGIKSSLRRAPAAVDAPAMGSIPESNPPPNLSSP